MNVYSEEKLIKSDFVPSLSPKINIDFGCSPNYVELK